ncbi:MAG: hypothetical protein DRP70_15960 [Spirochaetes bacterium]|nr:MAG: hypothetical protein DRP70_15960 [Spirochaetota bacterium]
MQLILNLRFLCFLYVKISVVENHFVENPEGSGLSIILQELFGCGAKAGGRGRSKKAAVRHPKL